MRLPQIDIRVVAPKVGRLNDEAKDGDSMDRSLDMGAGCDCAARGGRSGAIASDGG
jgi:hypothetical protein